MLEVSDLSVRFGDAHALRGASFALAQGERLGIVGESGSGKSMLAQALMGMVPERGSVSGSIRFDGQDMANADQAQWRALRAQNVAMIFQEPMAALNPLRRVGTTIMEPLRVHLGLDAHAARQKAVSLLEEVGLPEPERRLRLYPHELSGGQRQRVLIALALACAPQLLIADEPTTALDAAVALRITDLLIALSARRRMSLVLISHDLAVVARATDRVMVLYGGDVVETGVTRAVLEEPVHPYTRGLLAARPKPLGGARTRDGKRPRLSTIPGTVPALTDLPQGCRFAGRCDVEMPVCATTRPPFYKTPTGHSACHRHAPQAPTGSPDVPLKEICK